VTDPQAPRVVVVGAGISGVACARALHAAGVAVRVRERASHPGGRMAVRTAELAAGPHAVDVGASYFTVRDDRFAQVAERWREKGLAREWTDTFHLATPTGLSGTTTGPRRWSAARGLRSLVVDLADGLDVHAGRPVARVQPGSAHPMVDGEPAAAVVLAMPDPQAANLLPETVAADLGLTGRREWAPALCVWAGWPQRWWPELDGAFVDDSPVLRWVCDDGRRRGDGTPVLVAHTTAIVAAGHLGRPEAALPAVLAELPAVLGTDPAPEPELARVERWAQASPLHLHEALFGLHPAMIGVCGDGWGPQSRVEQAWLSGHLLGEDLARRLT
jgi:renalase